MINADLKQKLDSLSREDIIRGGFKYPVSARAGLALVEAIDNGEDIVEGWGAYGHDKWNVGVCVPGEVLGERIYVPKPYLILDKEEKAKSPFGGIQAFSCDHANVFTDYRFKSNLRYERLYNIVAKGTGASRLKKLIEDPGFRRMTRLYSEKMIKILKEKSLEEGGLARLGTSDRVIDLSRELIDFYISEMQ
jgi:hypothetical protein